MEEMNVIDNPVEIDIEEPSKPVEFPAIAKTIGLIGVGATLAEGVRFGIGKARIALAKHKAKKAAAYNTINAEADVIDSSNPEE
jgi:hypothetical protein